MADTEKLNIDSIIARLLEGWFTCWDSKRTRLYTGLACPVYSGIGKVRGASASLRGGNLRDAVRGF